MLPSGLNRAALRLMHLVGDVILRACRARETSLRLARRGVAAGFAAWLCLLSPLAAASGIDAAREGQKAYEHGDDDKALALFAKAVASGELTLRQQAIALNDRAMILVRHQRNDEALSNYVGAISADPSYAPPYYGRGLLEDVAGKQQDAIKDFSTAISLSPKVAHFYYARAVTLENRGDHREAIADCTEAIKLQPNDAGSYVARGNAFASEGDYDKALADFDAAVRLKWDYASAHFGRGVLYRRQKQYNKALTEFDVSLKLAPSNVESYLNRGITYLLLAQYANAYRDIQAYNKARPTNAYGLLWQHIAAAQNGIDDKDELAVRRVDLVVSSDWVLKLVDLYLGRSTEDAVLAALRTSGPDNAANPRCSAHFFLGGYALEHGAVERARNYFRETMASRCVQGEVDVAAAALMRLDAASR